MLRHHRIRASYISQKLLDLWYYDPSRSDQLRASLLLYMTGEFTYVSRPRSPRRAQRKDKFKTQESSVEWIDERFRDTQTRFQQSALCRRYIGTERRHSPESRVINRDAQIEEFEEVVIKAGLGVPERFVCLGLGGFVERPPFRRRVSEVQLSLFLELNTLCKVCCPFVIWS